MKVVHSNLDEFARNMVKLLRGSEMAKAIRGNDYQYVKNGHDERKRAQKRHIPSFLRLRKDVSVCAFWDLNKDLEREVAKNACMKLTCPSSSNQLG
jgi:hypothetical protein